MGTGHRVTTRGRGRASPAPLLPAPPIATPNATATFGEVFGAILLAALVIVVVLGLVMGVAGTNVQCGIAQARGDSYKIAEECP